MIRSLALSTAAVAALVLAVPAEAEWVNLGSVHVEHGRDRDVAYSDFAGPVENLTFTARGSDMSCHNITAVYGDGEHQRVFSGKLYQDRAVDADVQGRQRRIERLAMTCTAANPRGGELRIGANVGRFRDAWVRTKFWATHYARELGDRVGWNHHDNWVTVGRENFDGRHDAESTRVGWNGHRVDRIALRPVDNAARCLRVQATFANGRTRDIYIERNVMERGRMKVLDLPGDDRDLKRVDLHCQAVGDRDVTIEVLTSS